MDNYLEAWLTGPELHKMLKWPRPLPLEDERVRLMHEVHVFNDANPNIYMYNCLYCLHRVILDFSW